LFLIDVPPTFKLDQTKSPSRKADFPVFARDRTCRDAKCQVTPISSTSLGDPTRRGEAARRPSLMGGHLNGFPRERGFLLFLELRQFRRDGSSPCSSVLLR